jgi:hypothetical protein
MKRRTFIAALGGAAGGGAGEAREGLAGWLFIVSVSPAKSPGDAAVEHSGVGQMAIDF